MPQGATWGVFLRGLGDSLNEVARGKALWKLTVPTTPAAAGLSLNTTFLLLPSPEMWKQVEGLAPLTGRNPVPELKTKQVPFEKEKFRAAGLTPMGSELVRPARVKECPVHMEAREC